MKSIALATALVAASPLPAAPPAAAQEGPKLSDDGFCVAIYNAMARARERRAKSPARLFETAGFFSIDFAARAKALRPKAKDTDFNILYHQQAYEESFDGIGGDQAEAVSLAIIETRKCDTRLGHKPALLDRIAAMPAPPVEPYACAVNYWALGMGMQSNPNSQRAVMSRIGTTMARFDKQIAEDSVWRDIVRARIQADAAERNKAVGEAKIKPQDLFAHSQACDAMLAKPPS